MDYWGGEGGQAKAKHVANYYSGVRGVLPWENFDFGSFIKFGGIWDCFHTNIIYHLGVIKTFILLIYIK